MIDDGYIFGDEAQKHHFSHVITRALGFLKTDKTDEKTCDLFKNQPKAGETVLLCSDGLTNMVSDEEIYDIVVNAESLDKAGNELVKIANEKGGHDNITVSLITYTGGEKL
jgi:protein phosphatase